MNDARTAAEELGLGIVANKYLDDFIAARNYAIEKLAQLPRSAAASEEPAHVFRLEGDPK